jgi:hypothetical protein
MLTDESEVERRAGIDMVPIVEWFKANSEPDNDTPIFATTVGTRELRCFERFPKK